MSFKDLQKVDLGKTTVKMEVSFVGYNVDLKDVLGGRDMSKMTEHEFENIISEFLSDIKPKRIVNITAK